MASQNFGGSDVGYIARGNDTQSKEMRDRRRATPLTETVNIQNVTEDSRGSQLSQSPSPSAPVPSLRTTPQYRQHMPDQSAMLIPTSFNLTPLEITLLENAIAEPPVTKETLEELNLDRIMNNINLRADVNFDDELYFRPNTETRRGQQKRREAERYWQALAAEIKVYQFAAAARHKPSCNTDLEETPRNFQPRLSTMFAKLKELLITLIPDRDHDHVRIQLDIPLLMQQVENSVLDIVGLSNWLCTLLKKHCAPMRDPDADKMVEWMIQGCQLENTTIVAEGLRYVFGMLETMKLDVANHQIRTFRILLIDDTVPFMQSYLLDKIRQGQLDLEPSRRWYEHALHLRAMRQPLPKGDDSFCLLSALLYGLLQTLVLAPSRCRCRFEDNFRFDENRLWKLHLQTQDLIYLDICCYIFNDIIYRLTDGRHMNASLATYDHLSWRIMSIVRQHTNKSSDQVDWYAQRGDLALEITRTAYVVCDRELTLSEQHLSYAQRAFTEFVNHSSFLYRRFQEHMLEKLDRATVNYARVFIQMSPLEICEYQRQRSVRHQDLGHQFRVLDEIAAQLAHIGVLHWRIWAPILYTLDSSRSERSEFEAAESEGIETEQVLETEKGTRPNYAQVGLGLQPVDMGEYASDAVENSLL